MQTGRVERTAAERLEHRSARGEPPVQQRGQRREQRAEGERQDHAPSGQTRANEGARGEEEEHPGERPERELQRGFPIRAGCSGSDDHDDDPEGGGAHQGSARRTRKVRADRRRLPYPLDEEQEAPEREGRVEGGFDGRDVEGADVSDARLEGEDRGERDEEEPGRTRYDDGGVGEHRR